MKNRAVGLLTIGLAALIGFIIFSFNRAMTAIVATSCTHGEACTMWDTINFQTNISIGLMIFVIAVGLYLIFFGKEEKIITKIETVEKLIAPEKLTKESYEHIFQKLDADEKLIMEKLIDAQGTLFQSDLVEKTQLNKVKVTRILDILEAKGLVERRRHGMTNAVILVRKKAIPQ
ncbi:MAG: MarR family transcriptional regulator [Nanoarchaeota archaeon]